MAAKQMGDGFTSFDLGPKLMSQDGGHLVLRCPLQWERVFGVGLAVFAFLWLGLGGSSRLTCDRPTFSTANCKVTRFFGSGWLPIATDDLGNLTAVQIVSDTRSSESGNDYQVYDVQLTGTKATSRLGLDDERDTVQAEQISETLQRFLANPAQPAIVVNIPSDWTATWLPAGSLMVAIALLRRKAFRFEFDRLAGTLQVFGANGQVKRELPLREIQAIAIGQSINDGSVGYRVVLVMKTGDRHPLTHTYSMQLKSKQAAAEAVRAFLKLPPVKVE